MTNHWRNPLFQIWFVAQANPKSSFFSVMDFIPSTTYRAPDLRVPGLNLSGATQGFRGIDSEGNDVYLCHFYGLAPMESCFLEAVADDRESVTGGMALDIDFSIAAFSEDPPDIREDDLFGRSAVMFKPPIEITVNALQLGKVSQQESA
jgi:hypothetical protein